MVRSVTVAVPCGDWVISRVVRSCVRLEDEAGPVLRRRRCESLCRCDSAGVRGGVGARLGVGAAASEEAVGGASHPHPRRALVPGGSR